LQLRRRGRLGGAPVADGLTDRSQSNEHRRRTADRNLVAVSIAQRDRARNLITDGLADDDLTANSDRNTHLAADLITNDNRDSLGGGDDYADSP
jgi:hypothetical protein